MSFFPFYILYTFRERFVVNQMRRCVVSVFFFVFVLCRVNTNCCDGGHIKADSSDVISLSSLK